MIKYSIITPVFNREDCIGRCIESVIRNLHKDDYAIEHIIVDDGSSDKTNDIVCEYERMYSHIKHIKFAYNKGTNAARNTAISAATGDFCIILDSDDYFVDDAVDVISKTILDNDRYNYFLFASNDRKDILDKYIEDNSNKHVFTYFDFLSGEVSGDFIHVISSYIIKKYPFNEFLRIYEGVFFLSFYKEAKNMLYTSSVITIRERNRKDSVSTDYIRIDSGVIKRRIISIELFLKLYEKDLYHYHQINSIGKKYNELLDNYILLSDYTKVKNVIEYMNKEHIAINKMLLLISNCKLGYLYRCFIFSFLFLKYKCFEVKMK